MINFVQTSRLCLLEIFSIVYPIKGARLYQPWYCSIADRKCQVRFEVFSPIYQNLPNIGMKALCGEIGGAQPTTAKAYAHSATPSSAPPAIIRNLPAPGSILFRTQWPKAPAARRLQ